MAVKGVLLDNIGRCSIIVIILMYMSLYGILVIVGTTAPSPIMYSANPAGDPKQTCSDQNACQIWWNGVLTDMTPQHQALWINMELDRPLEKVTRRPALAGIPLRFTILFNLDVVGVQKDGTETSIVSNSSHGVNIYCPAGSLTCDTALVFTETMLKFPTYRVVCKFFNPYAAFASAPLDPAVNMHFSMGYISQSYTQFEIGAKMFFVVSGSAIFLMYTALLFFGPGVKDDDGNRLSSTYEQRFVWWLGLFSIFFNNPFLILEIENPSIVLAGFNAFCVVTFLTSLLCYWLVLVDTSRLQAENGFDYHIDPSSTKLGVCFWLPKMIFAAIFWTISLAAYMFQRIMLLNDPAYSITEAFPLVSEWFGTFIATISSLYIIYFFALFVLTVRHWRNIRPTNKLVIGLTLFTLILSAVGIFLQAFTAIRTEAILTLAAYSAPNLYVWFLMFAFIPGPRLSPWIQHALQQDQSNTGYPPSNIQMERIVTDTSGVMGRRTNGTRNNDDDGYDDEVRPEDVDIVVDNTNGQRTDASGYDYSSSQPNHRRVTSQTHISSPHAQSTGGSQRQLQRSQYPPQPSRPNTREAPRNNNPSVRPTVRTVSTATQERLMNTRPIPPRTSQPPVAVVDVEDYDDNNVDDDEHYANENLEEEYIETSGTNSRSFAVGKEDDSENEQDYYDDNAAQYNETAEYIPESSSAPSVISSTNAVPKQKNSKPSGPHPSSNPPITNAKLTNGRRTVKNGSNSSERPGNPFADATGKTK